MDQVPERVVRPRVLQGVGGCGTRGEGEFLPVVPGIPDGPGLGAATRFRAEVMAASRGRTQDPLAEGLAGGGGVRQASRPQPLGLALSDELGLVPVLGILSRAGSVETKDLIDATVVTLENFDPAQHLDR